MIHEYYLITINARPGMEETIVDFLLTVENEYGFSSYLVSEHGNTNRNLSITEQVDGRQKRIQFQMYVSKNNLAELITRIKAEFSDAGMRYWIVPMIEHGLI
jgi:hypothetical protein